MLGHRKLEIEDYWAILSRRKWIILLPLVVLPALAVGLTYFIAPTYESQTLVLIEQQKVPDDYVKPVISSDLDDRLASMKEQILSRSRVEPIIERYNLYAGKRLSLDDRIEKVQKSISIRPIHSEIAHSGLPGFFIAFTAPDAHTAQLVCGEITSLFVGENLRSREASAQGTTDFLKTQLADAKRNLDEQDAKLAAFQRQYGGKLPSEQDSNVNMLTSLNTQLEASNQSLARMEQDRTYLDSMLTQQIQTASLLHSSAGSPAAAQSDDKELQSLLTQEADLSTRYTPDHPDMIAIKKKIADLRSKTNQHTASAKGGTSTSSGPEPIGIQQLRAQLKAADNAIQSKRKEQEQLQTAVRTYQERIAASPQVEEQYKDLTRDYETAQKFYDALLAKMEQSKMATDLERRQQGEQFRVMDEPNLPDSPKSPNRMLFFLGGIAAGLAVGAGLAALLEYKDSSIRTERDIWALTRLPTLAMIGVSGNSVMHSSPRPPVQSRGLWSKGKQVKLPEAS